MNADADIILKGLEERLNRSAESVTPPGVYLDPQGIEYLFQELTGLGAPPGVRYAAPDEDRTGAAQLVYEPEAAAPAPVQAVYEALLPVLDRKIPLARQAEDLVPLVHNYVRIEGLLQATRFPDGHPNLEITFAGVRGLLFYQEDFFTNLVKPLLTNDRFFTLYTEVEALVYLHGPVQRTIFYHLTYGDNMEHDWAPLVPVAIRNRTEVPENS